MKLNRVDRNSEAMRDRFVRSALGQEAQDLYFPRRKRGVLFGSFRGVVSRDESNVGSFVRPCQSKSWDVGKECRQPVRKGRIIYLDREDNQLQRVFACQVFGLSRTVKRASASSPPRRRASLTVDPTVSGPRARKSTRTP